MPRKLTVIVCFCIIGLTLFAQSIWAADWFELYENQKNGLMLWLPFNEGKGDLSIDKNAGKSVNIHNALWAKGCNTGDPIIISDKMNMSLPDVPTASQRKAFTIEAFCKPNKLDAGYLVLKKYSFGFPNFQNDGSVSCYLRLKNGKDWSAVMPGVCESGKWQHYVLACDGKNVIMYHNGKQEYSGSLPDAVAYSDESILIGSSGGWGNQFFSGEVGLIRIYDTALNSEDVQKEYLELNSKQYPATFDSVSIQLPKFGNKKFQTDNKSYESQNYALEFDGKNSYVEAADSSQSELSDTLTIGAWIKPQNVNPQQISELGYIVSKNNGNHSGYVLSTYYNGGLEAMVITDEGSYTVFAYNVLRKGQWQHAAFSWSNNMLQLFVDGIQVSKSVITKGKLKPFDGPLCIGKAADRDGEYFKGSIDDVKIFNTSFSSALSADIGKEVVYPASNQDISGVNHPRNRLLVGLKEKRKPTVGFEDLTNWSVASSKGISDGKLFRSQNWPLWGDYVAKLVMKAGEFDEPALKKIVVHPPSPIEIKQSFDGINLWVFGDKYWGTSNGVKVSVQVEDSNGQVTSIPMQSSEHPMVFWGGWYIFHRTLAQKVSAPAKFLSLTFYDFNGNPEETIYFDSLDFYSVDRSPISSKIPSWKECGFSAAPDSIITPLAKNAVYSNSVRKIGNSFSLTYKGKDETIDYRYTPETGTLSDITAVRNNSFSFQPAYDGGWVIDYNGTEYAPGDSAVKRTLQSVGVKNNTVISSWLCSIGNLSFTTYLSLSIKQKTIIADMRADTDSVKEFWCGMAKNVPNPILTEVPYLTLGEGIHKSIDPAILYTKGAFVSSFLDWYNSDASELFGDQKLITIGTDNKSASAIFNGGSVYYPKTDGKRNNPHEKLFISVSGKFNEVLPNIQNPPNKWLETTKSMVWATRMYYANSLPYMSYYDEEAAFWNKMHDYGLQNLGIRFHANIFRSYINFDGIPISLILDTDPEIGGDKKCVEMIDKIQNNLDYRVGFYTNYTFIGPLVYSVWDENLLTLTPEAQWRYGTMNAAQLKISRILDLQKKFSTGLKDKFHLKCSYLDQYTCPPLWRYTDYDSRVNYAGKYAPVFKVFARSLLDESKYFDGPVLSEGITQWMLSGFCDSYAQTSNPNQDTLVDFQLGKMHLLSNDCGYFLGVVASSKPDDLDKLLASEIAYGNTGHLFGMQCYAGAPTQRIEADVLKSYFMIQQIQQYYANIPVSMIRYNADGKLLTTEEAIPAGAIKNNQVYVKYANGLEVFVNRNPGKNWAVTLGGIQYILPPNGYVCRLPNEIIEYSALSDGRRIDFVNGNQYVYCNGGGKPTDFGVIKAAFSYMVQSKGSEMYVTPEPFTDKDTVTINIKKLAPALSKAPVVRITPINQDGKTGTVVICNVTADGFISFAVDGSSFKYKISK